MPHVSRVRPGLPGQAARGVAFGREVLGKSRELPERAEAMGSPALSLGLLASGEYEEALEVCLRGTELARIAQDMFLLWHNLDHLGRTYEALLDLQEARKVYEEALELGDNWGRTTRCFPPPASARWRPSPRIGRRLTPTPGEHTKQVPPSMCLTDSTSITRSRRCCVEGTSAALEQWCDVSPTDRGRTAGTYSLPSLHGGP